MKKYIDSERLKDKIEFLKKTEGNSGDPICDIGVNLACNRILSFIDSFRQEPRFPQYDNIVEKVFGAGNLEGWEFREAEMLVAMAKEELLKSLQQGQPSLPDNLDEAEFEYAQSLDENPANEEEDKMIYDAFKAGAEWMAKQGVTVNGYITDEIAYNGVAVILDSEENFKPEEEVIVQIKKK